VGTSPLTGPRTHLVASLALLAACATPVGVSQVDPRRVDREITRSALSSGEPSAQTVEVLTRLDLVDRFRTDRDGTLATLHQGLAPSGDADRLFALAELSFVRAEETGRRDHALAAAVYAYAFLFPGGGEADLDPFDPRVQVARNLHNRGLTRAFAGEEPHEVRLAGGRHPLPFGAVAVELAADELSWAGYRLERFTAAADLAVRGLLNRYRRSGLGAPLAASLGEPLAGTPPPGSRHIPPRLKVPVTAFLRLPRARAELASGELHGTLELYSEEEGLETRVDGRKVPLELEKSSSLALQLEGAPIYDFGFVGFRLGDYLPGGAEERLVFLHPYRPGRIPLVLVHGTFSSPATWAQLVNELENDPELSTRYQVWLFLYNSGNPIGYSAGILVETLREVVAELDPHGRDPALRRMVVAGHSQGGLLTKLTVVESGDRFWRNVSGRPFAAVDLEPESRELLQRSLFFEPLPFVRRVVFLSTPHRGSYLSSYRVVSLVSGLVQLPTRLTRLGVDLATTGGDTLYLQSVRRLPTSLDNMRPGSPFLTALSGLPIAPGVAAHSIVAVKGDGPLEEESDGVVRYTSAHLDGVESEKVVRSGHSVQERPEAIEEMRRILREHAAGG
jgi:hypothetical protein